MRGARTQVEPLLVVAPDSVSSLLPGVPGQWDSTEGSFCLQSFQARRHDTTGAIRVQQKIMARGHGRQGAGKDVCDIYVFFVLVVEFSLKEIALELIHLPLAPSVGGFKTTK